MPAKKALLIIIDALADRIIGPALREGRLPTFQRLADAGVYEPRCWSIFPSITPAATATLHTGGYPRDHGVAGAFWYDRETDHVAYFGDDIWVIMGEGPGRYFRDFQVQLNEKYLRGQTVYQTVRAAGRTAACLNSMWFKGDVTHEVHTPLLLRLLPGVNPKGTVDGPEVLCLADFVASPPIGSDEKLKASGGITKRYGFHDDTTGEYLLDLASRGEMPDLTIAYFPNNDYQSHAKGPAEALSAVEAVDKTLAKFFDARGGLDAFLKTSAVLITGDHSQTDTLDDADAREIDLDEVLKDFSLVPAGEDWAFGEQLMACPNMRSAQVYLREDLESRTEHRMRDRVLSALLAEPRVDQVLWAEPDAEHPERFMVATADRGRVTFRFVESGGTPDEFGNHWTWEGDLVAVGGEVRDGVLIFDDYPNAFERVAAAFFDEAGHIWVTARVGCEFRLPRTSTHPGGSHGALNKDDSTAPLIVAGLPDGISVPSPARTVDFIPLALAAMGVPFTHRPGDGRAAHTVEEPDASRQAGV